MMDGKRRQVLFSSHKGTGWHFLSFLSTELGRERMIMKMVMKEEEEEERGKMIGWSTTIMWCLSAYL